MISSTLNFEMINVKCFIINNKNIENIFAININNVFVVKNIFFNYIQNDFVNRKKRERDINDKNDVETSSKNHKCYNCDSIEHLTNKYINFHVFEHAFVD